MPGYLLTTDTQSPQMLLREIQIKTPRELLTIYPTLPTSVILSRSNLPPGEYRETPDDGGTRGSAGPSAAGAER
jgi:hypothetical protein